MLVNLTKVSVEPETKLIEVTINRQDAMRGRVRVVAPDGEDLIVDLPRGENISDGDIFGSSSSGVCYKMLIEPERVMKVLLQDPYSSDSLENAIKLGYSLGNRHLEVLIEDGTVYVPVTIGEEKIKRILDMMDLPITYASVQKVISTSAAGYHAGEDDHI
jgi:urease accessory protein UreE